MSHLSREKLDLVNRTKKIVGQLEGVERALNEALRDANPVSAAAADPKTMLQEKLQAARQTAPQYTVVETLGPPHRRRFHVELKWNGGSARGEGNTIKAAEAAAAQLALEQMERNEVD